ncbi:hypothetical protein RAAC3_TM7C00001G0110 [Candidatus Saccharibacteria bacterium RAAC3_TM7_1]|nr:hypothetical protein RAAC3_TM7C00001G0110 [Candidatus Saccharibacteria bacterium RAAC3_TM7_1]HCZ28235.1 prepilin-type N-terminal cleavage/methylation domain-containing protein [Candidatus Saccharibacteria bacterium]
MKKNLLHHTQQGFTAVELLITLFIAAIFSLAGYMLYAQLNDSGENAKRIATISSLVYDQLSNAHQYVAASGCTPNTSIPALTPTVTGFKSVQITTTVTCPFPSTTGGAANVSLITVKATYSYRSNTDTLSHAQYASN